MGRCEQQTGTKKTGRQAKRQMHNDSPVRKRLLDTANATSAIVSNTVIVSASRSKCYFTPIFPRLSTPPKYMLIMYGTCSLSSWSGPTSF